MRPGARRLVRAFGPPIFIAAFTWAVGPGWYEDGPLALRKNASGMTRAPGRWRRVIQGGIRDDGGIVPPRRGDGPRRVGDERQRRGPYQPGPTAQVTVFSWTRAEGPAHASGRAADGSGLQPSDSSRPLSWPLAQAGMRTGLWPCGRTRQEWPEHPDGGGVRFRDGSRTMWKSSSESVGAISPTATRLQPSAQGCEARATLGQTRWMDEP